ncbi:MAG: hypothetical protein DI528_21590 [Shinella sp.]|nr:MAG: hypothetical protein DI528_21590 [Shinella sp.]
MSDKKKTSARESSIAGASTGTLFASLISLMDDGSIKSILLILAPPVAVLVSAVYSELVRLMDEVVADWKISRQRARAEKRVASIKADAGHNPDTLIKAQEQLETLKLLEISISERRVNAIVQNSNVG